MRNWVVRIGLAVALATVAVPTPARAGRIAGTMSNLPPDLDDIGDEYIGIRIKRSTGLTLLPTDTPAEQLESVGQRSILPTEAFGRPLPTRQDLIARGQYDLVRDQPSDPVMVPVFYHEGRDLVFFRGASYDFTIPNTSVVDATLGVRSPAGVTRQAINLEFFRKGLDIDPNPAPKRTQKLTALLVADVSSQTINVIVPRPAPGGIDPCCPVVPYQPVPVVVQSRAARHGLLSRCRR